MAQAGCHYSETDPWMQTILFKYSVVNLLVSQWFQPM